MNFVFACLLVCLYAGQAARAENNLVLPFFNLSNDANLDWVGESLAENIREALAAEGVLTLEREDRQEAYRRLSIRPYSTLTTASIIRVAESLDADQVIYGTFSLTPPKDNSTGSRGSLRVIGHILNVRRSKRGPEFIEMGPLEDLAGLQSHLAWQTLQFITPSTAPSEEEFRKRRPVIPVEAVESYVRGLLAASPEQKLKLFTQAVQLDPQYSQANFQLGRLRTRKKEYRPAAEALQKVVSGDVHFREASFFLGICKYNLGDFDAAEQNFRSLAQTIPLNEAWNNLGAAQSRKNSPEALESFRKALEGDPSDPDYQFNVGYALLKQGNTDGAAERFRAVLDRKPDDSAATLMLGKALKGGSARQLARIETFERLKDTYEESAYWQLKAVLEPKK